MAQICYQNKLFRFVDHSDNNDYIEVDSNAVLDPAKLVEKVGTNNTLDIISPKPDISFNNFCTRFKVATAGGGVVENSRGEVLMILRQGWWDLPKGHLERGETIEQCALRECCEECGLDGKLLTVTDPLCTTRHFHNAYGEWEIKESHWFVMSYTGDSRLTPQTDEQITRAEWLTANRLLPLVATSYTTIKEVFDCYLQTKIQIKKIVNNGINY